ncbi:hypothetical protein ACJ73_09203 [Blastomyces percursus]|uniref:Uncharacterized protein n=1 Tax=Blastomyces percursus TaxID=1658174 RepID=A0A1J9PA93_9EURO|nr:hypothetical protein ACJ73_09203 [Blastomyces percursus]
MIRRLSTLINPRRAPPRPRENVEDKTRYYDIDNAVASSRPQSPLIDRQCLSPAAERQLQNACLLLSQKIEFSGWTELDDPCADQMDASSTSSRFPVLKISSFTIPEHIASAVNGDPAPGSDRLSNEHENGISDPEDKMCIDLKEDQELTHDYFVDAFEPEQSTAPLVEEVGKISSSIDKLKFPSHFSRGHSPLSETFTNPLVEDWKYSRSAKPPYGISSANDMATDIWTIQESMTAEIEQIDAGLHSTLPQSVNRECHAPSSSKERNISSCKQQIVINSQLGGSDGPASPALENNNPLDTDLKCQTATPAKQILRINTNLSPTLDGQTKRDLSPSPLSYAQSWTSRSTTGKTIIDANGLEKVLTAVEEQQRRLGLQRAVMAKMSGGFSLPTSPDTNRAAAAIHSSPPPPIKSTARTSPTWNMSNAEEQSITSKPVDANKLDEQTKNTLVRKLSRLTLGKKKSAAKMDNVLGFSAIVEAR